MSVKVYHYSISIDHLLTRDRHLLGNLFQGFDNRPVSAEEAENYLEYCRDLGWKVLPFGETCEGFSYVTGCPGHTRGELQHA